MEIKEDNQLRLRDIYGFLAEQPEIILKRLYEHPLTCLAVFRTLPTLAKIYVQRMLFLTRHVPKDDMRAWAKDPNDHKYASRAHAMCVYVCVCLCAGVCVRMYVDVLMCANIRVSACV